MRTVFQLPQRGHNWTIWESNAYFRVSVSYPMGQHLFELK